MKYSFAIIVLVSFPLFAYNNLSPAQVHARLVAGDSLQLLDVREVSEYEAGHIAEPAGRPIVVPANMPWSSGVLSANYARLAKDIDIIVNCRSGGRSASASAFLESKGFTRIFNMTNGFNTWSYESRKGSYGDGSGQWIGAAKARIQCSQEPTVAEWFFLGNVFLQAHRYVELHKVLPHNSPFENVSGDAILYYTIVLDEFGLPVFNQHLDLGLAGAELLLYGEALFGSHYFKIYFFSTSGEWRGGDDHRGNVGFVSSSIYRWYLIQPSDPDHIARHNDPLMHTLVKAYPNPFNGRLLIDAPADSKISIYDVRGRFVTTIEKNTWQPGTDIGSGLYIVHVKYRDQVEWKKVLYNK